MVPSVGSPGNQCAATYSYHTGVQLVQVVTPDGVILDYRYDLSISLCLIITGLEKVYPVSSRLLCLVHRLIRAIQ